MIKIKNLVFACFCLIFSSASFGQITGSGTTDYIPKFIGISTVGNSSLKESGGKLYYNGATNDGYSNFLLKGSANMSLSSNYSPSGHILGQFLETSVLGTYNLQNNQFLNQNIGSSFGLFGTGDATLQSFPGMNSVGSSIYKSFSGNINGFVSHFRTNTLLSSSGSISDLASFYGGFPLQHFGLDPFSGSINNYYGLYLSDVTANSDVSYAINNKWGIYQAGSVDKNYLNGNTMIGTDVDNGNKLNVNGSAYVSGGVLAGSLGINGETGVHAFQVNGTSNFLNNVTGTKGFFSDAIGIGTENTGSFKLAVEGIIGARKIRVTQVTPWADYVFDENYKLSSLTEVEQYIKLNKHLPEVPSAKQIQKEGIDIADMQTLQMKKIEELTLHLIELDKRNKKLEQIVQDLQHSLDRLKGSNN